MKTSIIIYSVISTLIAFNLQAADNNQPDTSVKKHTFGIQLGSGSAKYKGSSDDGDGIGQSYLYYNYQLDNMFSVEAGFNGGTDVDDWECEQDNDDRWTCRSDNRQFFDIAANKLSYDGVTLAAKADFNLTQRNSLYAKLGGQFYDYEFKRSSTKLDNDSGFGLYFEAGWQYRWDSGWGINAAYAKRDMGKLDTSTFTTGLSYSF
ncbi:outer membrane beta-barrel protein [Aliikangiella maris]|uniref:Porin family protein n=2 Tax=Aliikangiella maris TaxID=3162458 RepID=A0ABV2BXB2_9GAMM